MTPITAYLAGLRRDWHALTRAFVVGDGVVDPADTVFGRDNEQFSPSRYGDYLATSLGVYSCANLRAKLLSSVPLKLYRLNSNGDRDEVTSGHLWELLHKVNPLWTMSRLVETTQLSLCLWGSAFIFIERGQNGRGVPRELWWARPDRVRVVPHPTEYISGFFFQPTTGGPEIAYSRDEAIWLRYPNPIDQFSGLAPLAAARLSADVAHAGMVSNRNIFTNGMQMAGMIGPPDGQNLTEPQAVELEEAFARRFKGVDRAHRVAVMRYQTRFQQVQMTPKDAEFIEAMKWGLEDICRSFGVPLDLLGGQRTYANIDASERIMWANTIKAEARFLADELTEQLLPMFTGRDRADLAEFDLSGVDVLQESQDAAWARASDQIAKGAITINEWRADQGFDAVGWGDVAWLPATLLPVASDAASARPTTTEEEPVEGEFAELSDDERAAMRGIADAFGVTFVLPERTTRRAVDFGSAEHERIMRQFDRRVEPHEQQIASTTADLMRRQRRAVLDRLKSADRGVRSAAEAAANPFDRPRWTRQFRESIRPVFLAIAEDAGQATLDDMGLGISFDISDPNVIRALERQTQRFAREVNDTTWTMLKETMAEGIEAGEGIDQLADRVEATMGQRIRSSGDVIARTESTAVANLGAIESARQSGVVAQKEWLAALDGRTRETHVAAHGQRVGLDENFHVGGATGPGPGMMSSAAESANCRCAVVFVTDIEAEPERAAAANGHRPAAVAGVRG